MKKAEFFENLKKGLKGASESEVAEILAEYEDHFHSAMARGKTEEQVCESLGSVDQIIKGYKIDRIIQDGQSSKLKSTLRAALILLAMAPFNFLIFMGPFFVSVVVLAVFWALDVGFLGAALWSMARLLMSLFVNALAPLLLVMNVGAIALLVFIGLLLVPVTQFAGTLIWKYLKWNLDFARGN